MPFITLDLSRVAQFMSADELNRLEPATTAAAKLLESRKGPGAEFTG